MKGRITKKQPYGRIIFVKTKDGRELRYHATKGWRNLRK